MPKRRLPLIAGNWKMNGLKKDAQARAASFAKRINRIKNPKFEILLCPPAPLITPVIEATKGSKIAVGGQDCHFKENGAFTGDISPLLLKTLGCKYVIVGHSERRASHKETDAIVRSKAKAAHKAGLRSIICIGETLKQRETGRTKSVNRKQLHYSLPPKSTATNTVIAYEPVWAIGTGKVATPAQAQEIHSMIRRELSILIGTKESNQMRILYGGSMSSINARDLMELPDVDGGLIGGASLSVKDFWSIAQVAQIN